MIHARITSIDLLRGLVMVVMALDHTRGYIHHGFVFSDPADPSTTTPLLFLTRWVTHLCAPAFVFLAGIAARLRGQRATPPELSTFLLKRGFWLIALEVTVINFGWFFDPGFHIMQLAVIWALGVGMVVLALGHNILDRIQLPSDAALDYLWVPLHHFKLALFPPDRALIIAYPVLPWIGLMALGYCAGRLYNARHLCFHPNGRFAFTNGAQGPSVTAWSYQAGASAPDASAVAVHAAGGLGRRQHLLPTPPHARRPVPGGQPVRGGRP